MKQLLTILTLITSLLLTACGGREDFTIRGEFNGLGAQTVYATYYSDGGLKRISAPAESGRFILRGLSQKPTLVVVSLSDGTELAELVLKTGDEVKIKGDLADPLQLQVSGNSVSARIADWKAENSAAIYSGDTEAVNRAVAEYVMSHKKDMAAAAILVTHYHSPGHERMADSLLTTLDPAARPAAVMQNFMSVLASQLSTETNAPVNPMQLYGENDSLFYFNPTLQRASMIVFLSNDRRQRDSVVAALKDAYPDISAFERTIIVEISTAPDSAAWREAIRPDTVEWRRSWSPGFVASNTMRRLSIPRTPYFIVADSTGAQAFRGTSVSKSIQTIKSVLSNKK